MPDIVAHPLLVKFVEDVGRIVNKQFVQGITNYEHCWCTVKPKMAYDECHKIVMYLPTFPTYEPRKMHKPWLTVVLSINQEVLVRLDGTMTVTLVTKILALLQEVERAWIEEMNSGNT